MEELENEDIKREIANIVALPLIPPQEIITRFEYSSDMLQSSNTDFEPFINYIKKNYIINPRFNSINWNHYSTLCNRPRTNNQ
jgi:hypothetical protein